MNIAIMSHTKKQELMVQFCTAYCGVLSKHSVCGTNATGRMVAEATQATALEALAKEYGYEDAAAMEKDIGRDRALSYAMAYAVREWLADHAK